MHKMLCYVVPGSIAEVTDDLTRSALIRDKLREAIAARLEPIGVPSTAVRLAVGFDDETTEVLKRISGSSGLAPGRVVGGLLLALQRAAPSDSSAPSPVLNGLRTQQEQVLVEAAPMLRDSRCILSEVGTGVGKSILIAHLAAYVLALRDSGHQFDARELEAEKWLAKLQAENSPSNAALVKFDERFGDSICNRAPTCVIVAAPTVKDVVHLVGEYNYAVANHAIDPARRYKAGVVLGRGQFVSQTAVRELLEAQDEPDQGVSKWVAAGFPAGQTEYTARLKSLCPGVRCLLDDLRAVATDFPIADAVLARSASADDQVYYEALRAEAFECDILFVTHAMLCMDNMHLTWHNAPLLPRPLALFVDEAHLIEQIQSNVASKGLSMTSLVHTLQTEEWSRAKCKTLAESALSTARALRRALRAIPDEINQVNAIEDPTLAEGWTKAKLHIQALRDDLAAMKAKLGNPPESMKRAVNAITDAHETLQRILKDHYGSLTFSPMKRYPLLTTGPRTVDKYLAVRWATTPTVMLLSGTLLYPGPNGPDAAPAIRELALPVENTVATSPCQPSWLRSIPTLYTPALDVVPLYTPPDAKVVSQELLEVWLRNVADLVEDVANKAVGGTLVLMTGYERLSVLSRFLQPRLGERLVVQQRNALTLQQAQVKFETLSRSGQHPVWIATGGGWTGLDIRDKMVPSDRPDLDILLTDLVIPALPFGMNHTLSHAAKVQFNFMSEIGATVRLLRQAMGRLVRMDGVEHRNIWILDGRIFITRLNYASRFRTMLKEYYEKQKTFKL